MKPMLCAKATLEVVNSLDDNWIAEEKYDGIRAVIKGGKLFCRRGNDITYKYPEFKGIESIKETIDGEVICATFSEAQSRIHTQDKFKIKILAIKSPATFVAFDCVDVGRLSQRRATLESISFPEWVTIAPQREDIQNLWDEVMAKSGEGIVVKNVNATYQEGKRSPEWLKVKAFLETTATFVKLDEHPRGVRLETADGKSVNCNGAQAEVVKKLFAENGFVEVEVQYMPQENSDAWRFPSFKRLVGDV